ncbi:MAG: UDP-N-acetylmuramoyl-tripeptide--D-alanyl-D-alanine ligase [Acidobacteria bacterium]|nr:UDP-N-acetylmuramoyl-tripeptide--D-alanyl-D-alanine ligase [Acidobacteriota bacterium]
MTEERRPGPFGPGAAAGPEGPALQLRAAWVAAATAGELVSGDAAREFGGVSIDTRTLAVGELFIAIRGDRFDGAEFVPAALDAGAAGVVVPRGRSRRASGGGPNVRSAVASAERSRAPVVIEVDDTVRALQALARAVRRASGTKVVAITGSAGKTTTKEITAEFLAARYRVIRNRGNFNNHIGLPLSLIELRQRPEIAVVELGMNHAGEISTLIGVAEPDVRVWTNVGDAHLGFFASVDAIADAKAEVLEGADASTLLVANADDDRVMARVASFRGRTVTFGIDRDARVKASSIVDRGIDGIGARVTTARGGVDLATPLVGRGNLANVLAAAAVATEFDVPLDAIAARAATLRPAPHRGEVVRLAGGVTLLDDSYNASPAATTRALEVLAHLKAGRRIAVLGEMLELGEHAAARHRDVGRAAAEARVDVLLAVGGDAARALAEAAVAAGMPRARVRHFATSEEAAEAAVALVTGADLVLVKGSRGVKTDRVVERLKAARA